MKQRLYTFCSRLRAGLLVGALLAAASALAVGRFVHASEAPKVVPVTLSVNDTPISRNGNFTTSFAPVVKRVAESVVKIEITTKSKTVPGPQMPDDDFFRRFFGQQFNNNEGNNGNRGRTFRTPREHGLGSGVIVSKDGYILTNNHVVEEADDIEVYLNDGRQFKAKVIGRDPKTDIAVVKIDAKDLPFITIGDSDKIEIGDLCLAVGNPFGIGQTVTMGIISAKGRGLDQGDNYEDFLQTDAAINPGNSGGALVDAEGRLIGINTAILSRSGGYQGIGFAVPINMARMVMESLISTGKVVRGYLGVGIQDVTPQLASEFKLPEGHGALVADVMPHSPAARAGLQSGDVIVDFNHKPIVDSRHLKLSVAETTPGTTVPIEIVRDGHQKSMTVSVKELPGTPEEASASENEKGASDTLNGVTVSDLDPDARAQLKLPANVKGAVVTEVDQNSVAYEAGLRQGDVIEEINRTAVHDANDAVKLTTNVKDKVVLLKIWSNGGNRYLVVDESKTN